MAPVHCYYKLHLEGTSSWSMAFVIHSISCCYAGQKFVFHLISLEREKRLESCVNHVVRTIQPGMTLNYSAEFIWNRALASCFRLYGWAVSSITSMPFHLTLWYTFIRNYSVPPNHLNTKYFQRKPVSGSPHPMIFAEIPIFVGINIPWNLFLNCWNN